MQLRRRADGHRRADRHGTPALARFGSDELRASSWRPPSPATWWPAWASASPAAAPTWRPSRPRRKKDGGDYVINGTKMWITNGLQADWCCLLANTSEGPAHKNKS
jgi:citronellyl-CoA dehydrogenase